MYVKQRMTATPFTVEADATVPEAIAIMRERRIRHLPVLRDGSLVGVLSQGDVDKASPSEATSFSIGEITYLMSKLKVSRVMSKNPITVHPDDLLESAAVLMRDNKIEFLPVVEDGKVVGVITESTMLDSLIDLLGFRALGSRLEIEAEDVPGNLHKIGEITERHGANITHIATFGEYGTKRSVMLGLNTLNTEEIIADLEAVGIHVIGQLRND